MTSTLYSLAGGDSVRIPEHAAVAVLALLGASGLLAAGVAAGILLRRVGRPGPARWAFRAAAAAVVLYTGALVLGAAGSRDRLLPPGHAKVFCEIDCHLALSLVDAERRPSIGSRRARGDYLVVRLRTWFDPRTISPRRGNAPLWGNPRRVILADSAGRRLPRSDDAEAALGAELDNPPLSAPVRPGEAFETRLVFEVPSGANDLRLLVASADLPSRLLIGHESSPGHGKTWFEVP